MAPEEVKPLDLTVDEAFRYCITAGMWTKAAERAEGLRLPGREPEGGKADDGSATPPRAPAG